MPTHRLEISHSEYSQEYLIEQQQPGFAYPRPQESTRAENGHAASTKIRDTSDPNCQRRVSVRALNDRADRFDHSNSDARTSLWLGPDENQLPRSAIIGIDGPLPIPPNGG